LGHSAGEAVKSGGGELARSLIGGGRSGSGRNLNRHSQSQNFLNTPNADGQKQTFKENLAARHKAGENADQDYMFKKEKKRNEKGG
jgi:hypothetical protein